MRNIHFGTDPWKHGYGGVLHGGSYMSAHVLLNLLNELKKSDKMRGLVNMLSLFHNESNTFNNTGARMLDTIYHMTLKLLKIAFWRESIFCLFV